jgi:hypothetical protein
MVVDDLVARLTISRDGVEPRGRLGGTQPGPVATDNTDPHLYFATTTDVCEKGRRSSVARFATHIVSSSHTHHRYRYLNSSHCCSNSVSSNPHADKPGDGDAAAGGNAHRGELPPH